MTKHFYAPKLYNRNTDDNIKPKKTKFPLFQKLWISSEQIAKTRGIDMAVQILMMQFGCVLFTCVGIWSCVLLIPINVTDDYITTLNAQGASFTDLETTYITNITPKSPRLWAYLISIYVISIFIMGLLWKFGQQVTYLKSKYQRFNKSVLLLNIPQNANNLECNPKDELHKVFPPFEFNYITKQSKHLVKLYTEYDALKIETEYLTEYYNKCLTTNKPIKKKDKKFKPSKYGEWGTSNYGNSKTTTDLLEFNYKRLEYLRNQIINYEKTNSSAAILTFSSISNSIISASALYTSVPFIWRFRKCPARDDIIWKNVQLSKQRREIMNTITFAIFVILLLFFVPLSTAIQGLINFEQLNSIPVVSTLINLPFVANLLKAILPSLVLTLFIMFVPAIIVALNIASGMISHSDVDIGLTQKLFIFQFLIVFVASFLGGTLFNQISTLISDPSQIINIIGSTLPSSATFFMTFILLNGIAGRAFTFIRIVGGIIYTLRRNITSSDKARDKLWMNQETLLGEMIVSHTMTIMIGIIFCCQAPIITGMCLYYFILNTAFEIYNVNYVFDKVYENNGSIWHTIFSQIMVGVYIFELMMFLQLGLKQFIASVILIPLIAGTILYHIQINRFYKKGWCNPTLVDARNFDIAERAISTDSDRETEYFTPKLFELGTERDDFGEFTESVQDVKTKIEPNVSQTV
jgi:hypothetical protein